MRYITNDDLTTDSYQRFITESSSDIVNTLDKCEARAIGIAKTYLDRYSITDIFGTLVEEAVPPYDEIDWELQPIRNELLVDLITKITLYRLFKRNAARKLPDDIKEDFDWSIKQLEKIQTGITKLPLPPAIDETGTTISQSIWGNNTNSDYYI